MASCTYENWTLKDISFALKRMNKENKEIVVPMFQRGKRWKHKQEEAFIDSLIKSYPVGTMLFYRTVDGQKEIYTLVDGLQRGNTIKKYMAAPTQYFTKNGIPQEVIDNIYQILGLVGQESLIKDGIMDIIINQIQKLDTLSGVQYYPCAKNIVDNYPTIDTKAIEKVMHAIEPFFKDVQNTFEKIANTIIPVIIYSGDEDSLPEIFDRINSRGTKLTTYEIYAASWPINKKFNVDNEEIVGKVLRKYDLLADDDYKVAGYNRDEMRKNHKLNAFEYVFGLSRFLNDKYDFLHFENKLADDEINPMGFELINACINDSNEKIKSLYRDILNLDINLFEQRLLEVINFVGKIIAKITMFKGNNRDSTKILHSKYQIMSMISTTFKEKYELSDLTSAKKTWNINRALLEKNMIQHYVNDIFRNEWNDGGTSKIHKVAKPNKYLNSIPKKVWESTLNAYFEQNNMRQQSLKVVNPSKEDIVILNCIYLPLFTASDQLSINRFDIEHIATKDQMRSLIASTKSNGLPISSIANLCYLPEKVNRSKGSKTFYQDINYRKHINIEDVEKKYSFTKEEDLEWMEMPYTPSDAEILKEYYMAYLNKRFKKQKEMFYLSLGIEDSDDDIDTTLKEDLINENEVTFKNDIGESEKETYSNFHADCVRVLNDKLHTKLKKQSRSVYISEDNSIGIAISVSKKYQQGNRDKYWFAYRTSYAEKMESCKKKYLAYACENSEHIVLIPAENMEATKYRLNYTEKDGRIHWHIVIFKNDDGGFSWQHSIPDIMEVDLSEYIV